MSRVRPDTRFHDLVCAAADVFIASAGFARTQMDDIAKAAGVSKGTLYNYFESKEAVFDAAVRFADSREPLETPSQLPVPTPRAGATAEYITSRLTTDVDLLDLAETIAADSASSANVHLDTIVRRLYRVLNKNRSAIKLIDVCAAEHPDLASLWYQAGRGGIASLLQPYIERNILAGNFVGVPNPSLAARFVLESCMFWAIHIHWDPHPESIDYARVEDTVVHFVTRGLLPGTPLKK